jgi:ketosteroid isomerase-like protein
MAIRALIDAYARCADRRDAEGQKALFTEDTTFVVHMDGQGTAPTSELHGREQLAPVSDNLNTYETTTHFNGQSSIELDGDRATGESYCMAHHVFVEGGARKLMVAAIRYDDVMKRTDAGWRFAQRRLYVDWVDTRTLG